MNALPRPAFILILGAASSICDKEFGLQPCDFKGKEGSKVQSIFGHLHSWLSSTLISLTSRQNKKRIGYVVWKSTIAKWEFS